jgi:ketosteroid isomerase-like protein
MTESTFTDKILTMFAAIDSCRWQELVKYFHPRVDYVRPGYEPISGLVELLDFYENRRIIQTGHHTVESIWTWQTGTTCSVVGIFKGVGRDGRDLQVRFCDVYHLEDGMIRHRETFFSSPAV